jgi:hypothetical protein
MWYATVAMTGIALVGWHGPPFLSAWFLPSPIGIVSVLMLSYILFSMSSAFKVPDPWRWLIVIPVLNYGCLGYLAFRSERQRAI